MRDSVGRDIYIEPQALSFANQRLLILGDPVLFSDDSARRPTIRDSAAAEVCAW